MRCFSLVVVLVVLAGGTGSGQRVLDPVKGPDATRVVVRGFETVERALYYATARLQRYKRPLDVAVVVDVTPNLANAEAALQSALIKLSGSLAMRGQWRMGRLGEKLGAPVDGPHGLVPGLRELLARDTAVVNTFAALRRTLRDFHSPDGIIVFLCDWHFEDDFGLEEFIRTILNRGQTFSVIGSEACFGRGWNDSLTQFERIPSRLGAEFSRYDPSIGRSPFENDDEESPWHGGETAWPHIPYQFSNAHWQTYFGCMPTPQPRRRYAGHRERGENDGFEDLRGRIKEGELEDSVARYSFALPSSFGPYGLMRLCGETGGSYVVFPWNRDSRVNLQYDFGRCDLYAPDLRSRKKIHADLAQRPLVQSMLKAWNLIGSRRCHIADFLPPFEEDGRTPTDIELSPADRFLGFRWMTPADHKRFLVYAKEAIPELDRALLVLDQAIRDEPSPGDTPSRRYLADALLFRHHVLMMRFLTGEALAAASEETDDAWDDPNLMPGVNPLVWIGGYQPYGSDRVEQVTLFNQELGSRVRKERNLLLEKFRETPYGETIRRNSVSTYRLDRLPFASSPPPRRPPAQSNTPKPKTPPSQPGSSATPGTTSGSH